MVVAGTPIEIISREEPVAVADSATSLATTSNWQSPVPAVINQVTGQGTSLDKNVGATFVFHELTRELLENTYRKSWAAAKMIDIPIKDVWLLGRSWSGKDESSIKKMNEECKRLDYHRKVARAMRAASLYGSAFVVFVPKDLNRWAEPVKPEELEANSLSELLVVDRNSCAIESYQTRLGTEEGGYGQPWQYRIYQRIAEHPNEAKPRFFTSPSSQNAPSWVVHKSWLLRMDGIEPLTTEGWWSCDTSEQWGISILHRAIDAVLREENAEASIGHLMEEASLAFMKIDGLKEAMLGRPDKGEPTLLQRASMFNMMKSIFRTQFIDTDDEIDRLNYAFTGIPEVMNGHYLLLAAIGDIPQTRFMGRAPQGMDATGDGDMDNYEIKVVGTRNAIQPEIDIGDMLVARNVGMDGPPEHTWHPLSSLSELAQAEILLKQSQAAVAVAEQGLVQADEVRQGLSRNEWWGELAKYTQEMDPHWQEREAEINLKEQQAKAATMKPAAPAGSPTRSRSSSGR